MFELGLSSSRAWRRDIRPSLNQVLGFSLTIIRPGPCAAHEPADNGTFMTGRICRWTEQFVTPKSADVRRIVELSEQKRTEYEEYQPIFWRKAHDSASAQKPYFEHLLTLDGIIALVYECEGTIQGFVIANLANRPSSL